MSEIYTNIDSCPQTFFFTLIHQMKIKKAKNILEIACGQGLLLPFVMDIKNKDTQYVATDINPFMI
jgi:ubiquinone/menaquinone biosynthesis C-methylase UbiE